MHRGRREGGWLRPVCAAMRAPFCSPHHCHVLGTSPCQSPIRFRCSSRRIVAALERAKFGTAKFGTRKTARCLGPWGHSRSDFFLALLSITGMHRTPHRCREIQGCREGWLQLLICEPLGPHISQCNVARQCRFGSMLAVPPLGDLVPHFSNGVYEVVPDFAHPKFCPAKFCPAKICLAKICTPQAQAAPPHPTPQVL